MKNKKFQGFVEDIEYSEAYRKEYKTNRKIKNKRDYSVGDIVVYDNIKCKIISISRNNDSIKLKPTNNTKIIIADRHEICYTT